MKPLTTVILLLLSANILFGQMPADTARILNILDNKEFKIQYPPNWELNQNGLMGTRFLLFSPFVDEQDTFRENVNLFIEDVSAHNITLDDYTAISENQVKTLITDSKIEQSQRVKSGKIPYQKLIYSGKQGTFDLKFEQYYLMHEGKVYILTFTSEIDQFEQYQQVGEQIMDSFEIKQQ